MNAGVAVLVAALAVGPLTLPSLAEAQAGKRPERFRPALSVVEPVALAIVQDRIYRAGVFLIVDALVENRSLRNVEGARVSVELDNFFDELVRMEPTALSPATLAPGQVAALRAATPYSETVRKIRYRFTWWQDGEQFQAVEKRDIWMTGSAPRAPGERLVGPLTTPDTDNKRYLTTVGWACRVPPQPRPAGPRGSERCLRIGFLDRPSHS